MNVNPRSLRSRRGIAMLAVVLTAGAACSEPIDCGQGPGRCAGTDGPKPAKPPAAPQLRPAPTGLPSALMPDLARAPIAGAIAIPGGQQGQPAAAPPQRRKRSAGAQPLDQPPLDPGNPSALPAGDPLAHAQLIHRRRDTPAALMRRIVNVAANHNLSGLKRFMTPELQVRVDQLVAKSPDRFWRQLDKYAAAGANGFELKEADSAGGRGKQLLVTARDGAVLHPVIERDKEGWLFARF